MSVRIDASGDYLERSANLPGYNAFTVCGWFMRLGEGDTSNWECVISVDGGEPNYHYLYCEMGGTAQWGVYSGANSQTGGIPSNDVWYFIALTCNGTNTIGYYALVGATSLTSITATADITGTSSSLRLGGNSSFGEWANGRFANFKIFDSALSEANLLKEMHQKLPMRTSDLNLWSPNSPGATERLRDYHQGRNWTAGGTLTDEADPPIPWGASPLTVVEQYTAGSATLQYARPSSTISTGSWVNELGGSDLYLSIDEETASDTDYITTEMSAGESICEVALSAVDDPSTSASHVLSYRYEGKNGITLTVELLDGAVVTGSWVHTITGSGKFDAEQTLTDAQADSISNYADLRLKFKAKET